MKITKSIQKAIDNITGEIATAVMRKNISYQGIEDIVTAEIKKALNHPQTDSEEKSCE